MRSILSLALLACPVAAQDGVPDGIGGIGTEPCAAITGVENAPLLAQAGDWALGYMAGRLDAGQTLVAGEPLSASSSVDVIAAIALRCREAPDMLVLDAVRAYGARVFGTEAADTAAAIPPTIRPMARPDRE